MSIIAAASHLVPLVTELDPSDDISPMMLAMLMGVVAIFMAAVIIGIILIIAAIVTAVVHITLAVIIATRRPKVRVWMPPWGWALLTLGFGVLSALPFFWLHYWIASARAGGAGTEQPPKRGDVLAH
jgi:hypothetical protein